MFNAAVNIDDVARAIQLALAPVFLLTGIAGLLNVMAGRLSRIIDRGRRLTENPFPHEQQLGKAIEIELQDLDHRRHLTGVAITACTLSALGVCTVIAALFLEVLIQIELNWFVGITFTASTLALVVSLAYFLREVHLATKTVRIPVTVRKHGSDKNER